MNLEEKVLEIMREVFDLEDITIDVSQKNCAFDLDLEPEEIAEMTDFSRVIAMLKSKL